MTWVDVVVFGFISISGLLAFARGLVREMLGIGAWIGAGAAGYLGLPVMHNTVRNWVPAPDWINPVSFVVVFLATLILLLLIARMIGQAVRRSMLGGVDRTLGLVFGLARGAAVVIVAYIIGQMVFPIERWPDAVLDARTLAPTYEAARWVREQLPKPFQPHPLDPPPAVRKPTAEALLRAAPQGRAIAKPFERE